MKLVKYASAAGFISDCMDTLMRSEAQNNLIIGNALRGREAGSDGYYMACVKDADGVVLCAIMTPPFNLVLYCRGNAVDRQAAVLVADDLVSEGVAVPGVLAEKRLSDFFAAYYSSRSGADCRANHSMSVMYTERVRDVGKAPGRLRPASAADLYFLPYWESAFGSECNVEQFQLQRQYELTKGKIESGSLYIWQDGVPVSTARSAREMQNGVVISGVYTPPFYRGRGYATSCVASLSSRLLERHKFCCLFVDNANPISNKIYRNIGYGYICDYQEYKFKNGAT